MKQYKVKYDFKAFGQAIKEAGKAKGISHNQLADRLNIALHYIASIDNSGLPQKEYRKQITRKRGNKILCFFVCAAIGSVANCGVFSFFGNWLAFPHL